MLIGLLVFMLVIEAYLVIRKHNLLHPIVYFFGIWIVCILFTIINYYGSLIEITSLTKTILVLGIGAFYVGVSMPRLKINKFKMTGTIDLCTKHISLKELYYSKSFVVVLLSISLFFNLFMTFITVTLLRKNIPYSSIRDIFLSYEDNAGFFASTFFSTFNSWISTPCTYAIAILLAIDMFKKRLDKTLMALMALDIALFTFATSGRLLLLIFAIQVFFCLNYFKVRISKKIKKKVGKWILFLILALVIITLYRSKDAANSKDHVNSIYSYFAISIPLLSKWTATVQNSDILGGCICTLNGIFEILHYLISKIAGSSQQYTAIMDILSLPQGNWVNIYPNYWVNAFCTMFYYFYIDLRELGVVIYSFAFGLFCKKIYRRACISRDERYLPLYLVIIQTIFCGFIRWQWGTFTYFVLIVIMLFPFWRRIKIKRE